MPTNDTMDPAVEEADRRVERAKASLLARVAQLKHKFQDAKQTLDLPAHISKHAWPAVGIAFALGAAAGLSGGSAPRGRAVRDADRGIAAAVIAALGALGWRVARELAFAELGAIAKQWWSEQQPELGLDAAARRPEPYVEH